MENTPQEPDGQRVSMCLITSITPTLTTHRKCVKFSEFKFGSTSSVGYELSHTQWMKRVNLKQIIKARM